MIFADVDVSGSPEVRQSMQEKIFKFVVKPVVKVHF